MLTQVPCFVTPQAIASVVAKERSRISDRSASQLGMLARSLANPPQVSKMIFLRLCDTRPVPQAVFMRVHHDLWPETATLV